jgi:hypothetical protein
MSWTALERRWLTALVCAVLPPPGGHADDPEALAEPLERLRRGMPPLQRLALRFAVWLVSLLAPLGEGRLPPFTRLDDGARDRALGRLAASDNFVVREMVVLIKLAAALARELDPAFRDAVGWGRGRPVRIDEAEP